MKDDTKQLFDCKGDANTNTRLKPPHEVVPYEHWVGMPAYDQDDKDAYLTLTVNFSSAQAIKRFAVVTEQEGVNNRTKSLWYPRLIPGLDVATMRYVDEE